MDHAAFFASLRFRWPWRIYQTLILERFERRDAAKRTFHVVAPPGSGKTLIGMEIARRIGKPAVALSPTTTIQEQWADKVLEFRPETDTPAERAAVLSYVSTDPSALGSLSCLTYQSLATQTQAREFLDRLGQAAWVEDLVAGGRTPEGAAAYLEEIRTKATDEYRAGVSTRARTRKRAALAAGEAKLEDLLHPNALDLVERIVAQDTGCLILDEAHHLLDYWAMIVAHLVGRLPGALVVGLTATPPASAEPGEMENYLALVDGIDFEVPTPAVVKAGSLAPYQDLVLITEPTEEERAFLRSEHQLLADAEARVLGDPRFLPRLEERINRPDGIQTWAALLDDEFEFAVGGVRWLLAAGRTLADDIEVVPEMRRPPAQADRLALVREWCLGYLRLSADPADRAALADLRAALRTLGLIMTDAGWRPAPSPIDRVLAYSKSKVAGMLRILHEESGAMGDDLRAVVLTDFERSSATALRRLAGVLDPEAGGAVQAIRAMAADLETNRLDPIMVTARTVLCDTDAADRIAGEITRWFEEHGLRADLVTSDGGPGLVLLDGRGPDWEPRHYVACVTDLFEAGVTRCLVGTRGLLSEGWDTLSLNTLIDLTTAGTFASVNQIRGRSIRLDPEHPRKVADNWDLACVASNLPEGWRDLKRFAGKHRHTWGLGQDGRIVRGLGHVDRGLVFLDETSPGPRAMDGIASVNRRSLGRARERHRAYDAWRVGDPYLGQAFRGTALAGRDVTLRTAFTWKKSLRRLLNVALGTLLVYAVMFATGLPQALSPGLPAAARIALFAVILGAPIALSAPLFWRYAKAAFVDVPVDSSLADIGRAVAQALRDTGLGAAVPEQVSVVAALDATYEVDLQTDDAETAGRFAEAYRDLFAPIVDQRYLVTREETSISGTFYKPIWYAIRAALRAVRRGRRAYHAVPELFGRKRELAEMFEKAWARWVGGGELVYTRSPEGARILLRERARTESRPRTESVEEWR